MIAAVPAILAAGLLVGAPAPGEQRADTSFVRRALRVIDRESQTPGEAARDLSALGPEAVPALFAILSGTIEPEEIEAGSPPAPSRNPLARPPHDGTDAVVLGALKLLPPDKVAAHMVAACRGDAVLPVRLLAVRILGEIGDASAVGAWIEVLRGVPAVDLASSFAAQPAEEALTRILVRDHSGIEHLRKVAPTLEPSLVPLVARSVAKSGQPEALPALAAMLGAVPEGEEPVVAAMGDLAEGTGARVPEEIVDRIRRMIGSARTSLGCAAAAAAARLHDVAACPALIEGLASPDAQLRDACLAALQGLSGGYLGRGPEMWRNWYDSERSWFERRGRDLLLQLSDRDRASVLDAARQLCSHALYKDVAATGIAGLLSSSDPEIAIAACKILESLGSRTAIRSLVDALGRPQVRVRAAAGAALVRLTGKELPPESVAWRPALGL